MNSLILFYPRPYAFALFILNLILHTDNFICIFIQIVCVCIVLKVWIVLLGL